MQHSCQKETILLNILQLSRVQLAFCLLRCVEKAASIGIWIQHERQTNLLQVCSPRSTRMFRVRFWGSFSQLLQKVDIASAREMSNDFPGSVDVDAMGRHPKTREESVRCKLRVSDFLSAVRDRSVHLLRPVPSHTHDTSPDKHTRVLRSVLWLRLFHANHFLLLSRRETSSSRIQNEADAAGAIKCYRKV